MERVKVSKTLSVKQEYAGGFLIPKSVIGITELVEAQCDMCGKVFNFEIYTGMCI